MSCIANDSSSDTEEKGPQHELSSTVYVGKVGQDGCSHDRDDGCSIEDPDSLGRGFQSDSNIPCESGEDGESTVMLYISSRPCISAYRTYNR